MPRRVAVSQLNASTIDILNTIRANASAEYQALVPEVATAVDIPRVGEVIYGYPALANQFVSALVNRIAAVRVNSATFNNAYAELKKGFLEFGETVEEVFVSISKVREFSAELAENRELKRTVPDVKSAFHSQNWRVQYPISIEDEELKNAFLSMDGVQDLIARIVNAVYTAAEYDEFLLFKYLIIKAVSHGKMFPIEIDTTNPDNAAVAFRGTSNMLRFMKKDYNAAGVTTTTPIEDQFIFMDANYNAQFDVKVLAAAFNRNDADFLGHLKLIDDFTTFDNDRFAEIRAGSDMIEEVTAAELALMANVKAVLVDREWFQIYDQKAQMTEKYVAAGMRWNYFYNVWKVVSSSPFSNAVVFVDSTADTDLPNTITVTIADKIVSENATVFNLEVTEPTGLNGGNVQFVQTQAATSGIVAVHKYGSVIFATGTAGADEELLLSATINGVVYNGSAETPLSTESEQGDTFTLTKVA